jgi:hypothetical protein
MIKRQTRLGTQLTGEWILNAKLEGILVVYLFIVYYYFETSVKTLPQGTKRKRGIV